ncbi:unnamed protein product [Stenotrophomonas maltophilia]|nr:unnamed protein product [Stenotrophomonas maltophilia]
MGLERVRAVATAMGLGAPAKRTIVVGGTNGKGSTVAFIEAIARAAGWKVGAYTSPHLLRYNERVRIDGQDVDDAALVAAFSAVEAARGETTLTYFEYGTLAALQLFADAGLDLAVLEVGLGGRLDAVNIVDADVAVITTVDIDHAEWLGEDREAIGTEKAGIIRGWKPVILGETDPPSSVLARAYLVGANAIRGGSDYFYEPIDAQRWRWRDVGLRMELPTPALAGPIQLANAGAAIAALRALDKPVPRAAWAVAGRGPRGDRHREGRHHPRLEAGDPGRDRPALERARACLPGRCQRDPRRQRLLLRADRRPALALARCRPAHGIADPGAGRPDPAGQCRCGHRRAARAGQAGAARGVGRRYRGGAHSGPPAGVRAWRCADPRRRRA